MTNKTHPTNSRRKTKKEARMPEIRKRKTHIRGKNNTSSTNLQKIIKAKNRKMIPKGNLVLFLV